jgi:hypothetical protein
MGLTTLKLVDFASPVLRMYTKATSISTPDRPWRSGGEVGHGGCIYSGKSCPADSCWIELIYEMASAVPATPQDDRHILIPSFVHESDAPQDTVEMIDEHIVVSQAAWSHDCRGQHSLT